ncbi:uncharacterized protein P174DRAFT_463564 [Aspergillus novofumigatus IBT 16806]|uniref:Uncharacterized protein n=1 Tax=Aspergillus novofumigatus (strain IBT 16806) TaxID=1392255 RepID=A0A2I1BXK7_ASPN1|nr:uncharacterized protein P174DRAFT_463564 [Aspergillus novofumigatus IBT 16806]PKX90092.1 hypothetical protein P174DRAFT_463564 [Aspergillus novofumigatus IBT 16806]
METIRDSAFGKLVRFFSGYRVFLYPEEMDGLTWRKYLQTPDAYLEEAMTETSSEGFYEQHTLYTVMSQCRRRQRLPLKSVLAGPWRVIHDKSPEFGVSSEAGILGLTLFVDVLFEALVPSPIVFEEKHGLIPGETGLAFLGIIIGAVYIALPVHFYWKYRWQSKHINPVGHLSPEEHLPPACFGAVCLPISLFWFGWTGNFAGIHWIGRSLLRCYFLFISCYEAQAYSKYAASVLAGNDFLRSSFGGGFPLFATQIFHNLGVGWACTLLGCLTVVFEAYPFLLYTFGERIRMRSK